MKQKHDGKFMKLYLSAILQECGRRLYEFLARVLPRPYKDAH